MRGVRCTFVVGCEGEVFAGSATDSDARWISFGTMGEQSAMLVLEDGSAEQPC